MGLNYGKMFKISSLPELFEYWQECRANRAREGFSNYVNSAEYAQVTGDNRRSRHHLAHPDAAFIHTHCLGESLKDKPRSVVEVTVEALDSILTGMVKTLSERGTIYVNESGGYFILGSGMEEQALTQVASWVIPGEEVRFKQWPGGTHWYAYVGSKSVEIAGANKWDTKAEAKKAAALWAKAYKVKIEDGD